MLASLLQKIISFFMSIIFAIGGLFGFGEVPKQNKEIKNVIYLIGDGMGFNNQFSYVAICFK